MRLCARLQNYKEWREGAHAQNKLNIQANAFCLKVVCKKGGGAFSRELTVLTQKLFMNNVISPIVKVTSNASGLIFGDNV